jgi:hypothetical protein
MKYSYLPILFILTLCWTTTTAQAPEATPDEKKVIIIKKKMDSDGQTTVEKIELVGEDAEVIIEEADSDDAKDIDHISVYRVRRDDDAAEGVDDVDVKVEKRDGETRIEIRKNDEEPIVIELQDDENLTEEQQQLLRENGVHINGDAATVVPGRRGNVQGLEITGPSGVHVIEDVEIESSGPIEGLAERIHMTIDKITDLDFDFDYPRIAVARPNANCVALGVYVDSHSDGALYVNSIIEGSGAQDAGLMAGDILRGIDKKPVDNHRELLHALSEYEPGDVVMVDYERDGILSTAQAEVRSWKELPDFADSWHARITCDDEPVQEVRRKVIIIKKGQDTPEEMPPDVNHDPPAGADNTLALRSFTAYPNPTEGKFRIEFEAEPNPVVVSVLDAAGKEVFRDNVDNFHGYYSKEVDLTGMAQGAFVLSVEQEGKFFTDQVVIH